jgi:ATP-dependent Clp protease adaptor protein ClpS
MGSTNHDAQRKSITTNKSNMNIQELEEICIQEKQVEIKELVVYNDDYNTFDHVITSLIEICQHEEIQAVQCTYLIHNTGKCSVKAGEFQKLKPLCVALLDRGLSACIE